MTGTGQDHNHHNELTRVAAIYDDIAPTWDERQGLVERRLMGQAMRASLARYLTGDVLEIGTGTGATLPILDLKASGITSLTGTDMSLGMLREARKAARSCDLPVLLVRMNAEALAFADATFDTVTTSLTLCTVPDPARALREMARVVKPGGRIVLLEHVRARNPLLALSQRALTPLQMRMLGCHLDRRTDRLVRDLGFRVEHEETRFFGIFRLIVARPPGA
ncbi:MAG: Methyltransferase type 11 [uncultured Thermomicrobiales bacterium]|uniref:Methyltransferase type 11 n=1 Tax=uncultured Thermomicrobiales bacterium TaxID=1645740 RepID=A0A6J4VEU7_9BACT|nr:MAG: Methyltransferase type 11 [uncultured Thermomicrobiales bacterium]